MSDSDSDDGVQLYSALDRRRKQPARMFVSLDSESESGDEWAATPPRMHRKRRAGSSPPSNGKKVAAKKAKTGDGVEIEVGEEDDAKEVTPKKSLYEDLLTPEELAAERERKRQMELEIALRLARDTTLSQTRAVMNKASSFQTQAANAIELLDSDSDGDDVEVVQLPQRGATPSISTVATATATAAVAPAPSPSVRGERIKLHVRSNGAAIDEIAIHMNDPFDLLYVGFCDLHGLPRDAVKMTLDGEELSLTDTPAGCDLDTGDLIDAKVDFSRRVQENVKRYLRLRLVVFGKRAEPFRIDARSKVEKLHASFCAKHSVSNPDDVQLSVNGQPLDLNEMVEFYGLMDDDEVSVEIHNYVDTAAIPVQLRFEDGSSSVEHVLPSDKVQVLFEKIAGLKQCPVSAITLRIDGETMVPALTFTHFDLEGDELIDVKLGQ